MTGTQIEFAGYKLKHPLGVSPTGPHGPPALDAERESELILRYVKQGASFVCTPTTRPEPTHPAGKIPTTRFVLSRDATSGRSFFTIGDPEWFHHRLDVGTALISTLKRKLPADIPVIASMAVRNTIPEDWANLARKIEAAGADLIQLVPSCPMPLDGGSQVEEGLLVPNSLGDNVERICEIVKAVHSVVSVPFGVKASPELGWPRLINGTNAFYRSGARFVVGVNGPVALAPPDIYAGGKGPYVGMDDNPFGAITGPWIRWLCYRYVASVAKYIPELDVAAVGGLVEPYHAVEALALGAKMVQVSSGIMLKGVSFLGRCIRFFEEYMEKQGYRSVDDFRGMGLKYISPISTVDWGVRRYTPVLDAEKCNGCGICATNMCFAITMADGLPQIRAEDCGVCGLCLDVCPTRAFTMVKNDN